MEVYFKIWKYFRVLSQYWYSYFFLNIFNVRELGQRFKIIYFLMGPWDPRAMILTGLRTLGMGPIIDVFIHCKFRKKMCPQDAGI